MIFNSYLLPRLVSTLMLDTRLQARHHMSNMIKYSSNRPINSYLFEEVSVNNLSDLWDDRYMCIIPAEIGKNEYFYYVKTHRLTGICFLNPQNMSGQRVFLTKTLRFHVNLNKKRWHYYPLLDFRDQEITGRFNKLTSINIPYDKNDILPYEKELIKYI